MDTHDVLYVHFKVIFGEVYSGLSLPQVRWMLLCTASPTNRHSQKAISTLYKIISTSNLKGKCMNLSFCFDFLYTLHKT